MVEIVANSCCEKSHDLYLAQVSFKLAQVNDSVHHLSHAEAMTKVVKRVVAVIGLNAQLRIRRPVVRYHGKNEREAMMELCARLPAIFSE